LRRQNLVGAWVVLALSLGFALFFADLVLGAGESHLTTFAVASGRVRENAVLYEVDGRTSRVPDYLVPKTLREGETVDVIYETRDPAKAFVGNRALVDHGSEAHQDRIADIVLGLICTGVPLVAAAAALSVIVSDRRTRRTEPPKR
jgi:hypothetical protein